MEHLSLIEKLKTLRQWQLQQQLEFAKVKDCSSDSARSVSNYDHKTYGANTEKKSAKSSAIEARLFGETIGSEDLSAAIKAAHDDSGHDSDIGTSNDRDLMLNDKGNAHSSSLKNWNMSGVPTVVFKDSRTGLQSNQMAATRTSYAINTSNRLYDSDVDRPSSGMSASEDGFSEGEEQIGGIHVEIDGVEPISPSVSEGGNDSEEFDLSSINSYSADAALAVGCKNGNQMQETGHVLPYDDRPLHPGIGNGRETFEDLLETQLVEEKRNIPPSSPPQLEKPHRFLRKGEGLSRFAGPVSKKGLKAAPRVHQQAQRQPSWANELKLQPMNRKIASISKKAASEIMAVGAADPPKEASAANIPRKSQPEGAAVVRKTQPMETLARVGSSSKLDAAILSTAAGKQTRSPSVTAMVAPSMMEASFQQMIENYKEKDKKEDYDLHAFEELEEAAENMSLSSDSSLVIRLLGDRRRRGMPSDVPVMTSDDTAVRTGPSKGSKAPEKPTDTASRGRHSLSDKQEATGSKQAVLSEVEEEHDSSTCFDDSDAEDTVLSGTNAAGTCFDDEYSWGNTSKVSGLTSVSDHDDTLLAKSPSPATSTPPAKSAKHVASFPRSSVSPIPSPEPSKLVADLFPALRKSKTTVKPAEPPPPNPNPISAGYKSAASATSESGLADVLKQKLLELESEISKFRSENDVLERLRLEREREMQKLKNDVESFQKQKAEELQRLEDFKQEEMKKLKNERRVFDKYQKAARAAPNKQEREEIECLKGELLEVREELKRRESKWNATSNRFRSRIAELERENSDLKEEVSILEGERRRHWRTERETAAVEAGVLPPPDEVGNFGEKPAFAFANVRANVNEEERKALREPGNEPTKSSPSEYREPAGILNVRIDTRKSIAPVGVDQNSASVARGEPGQISVKKADGTTEVKYADGKVEIILLDQSRVIMFPNGTKKTISADGRNVSVLFFNGDVKQVFPDGKMVYFYSESKTTHTTYPDGVEVLEFPNQQVEKRYPDGRTEISFPDRTRKYLHVDGVEETVFSDGTVQRLDSTGERTITFPNGQREIHTKLYKKREYPDGSVKTVYDDGRQETRYSSGRLRVKDKEGNLLIDTGAT